MSYENRAVIIGVNIRNLERAVSQQHAFADVVMIDQSNGVLNPLLYQLHSAAIRHTDEASTFCQQSYMPLEKGAFAMIGEVLSIDRHKKLIYMKNNGTVAYRHLVVASGLKQTLLRATHNSDLECGLHALIEAIRVRNNIAQSLQFPAIEHLGFQKRKPSPLAQLKPSQDIVLRNLQKLIDPYVLQGCDKSLDMALANTEKRLYQVQL